MYLRGWYMEVSYGIIGVVRVYNERFHIHMCERRVLRGTLSTLCHQVLSLTHSSSSSLHVDGPTNGQTNFGAITPPCNYTPFSIWTVCLLAQRNKTTAAYHRVQSSKYLWIWSRQWHNPFTRIYIYRTRTQKRVKQYLYVCVYVCQHWIHHSRYFFHRYLTKKGLDFDTLWCCYHALVIK